MVRLDYDHTNRLPWTISDSGTIHEDFHQFVLLRQPNTGETEGDLRVDNVRVESFPPYALAWWRCDDRDGYSAERLGSFDPSTRWTQNVDEHSASSTPLYDGQFDFHNERAFFALPSSKIYSF